MRKTIVLALIVGMSSAAAFAQEFSDARWGTDFSNCSGAREPMRFKVGNGEREDIVASAIVTCRDEGDAFVYALDYMNLALAPGSKWRSAQIQWIGAAAQRGGSNRRNEWIYDEAKPLQVSLVPGRMAAVKDVSFRVPKAVLAQARGFGFYVVGGGIFWSLTFQGSPSSDELEPAPKQTARPAPKVPAPAVLAPQPLPDESSAQVAKASLGGHADWGKDFPRCDGAQQERLFKAATSDNDYIQATGVIACSDAGSDYVFRIDYMTFALVPGSRWSSAHFEWLGAAAQRAAADGSNDWIYEEAKPIGVEIGPDRKQAAIANLSFRVSKAVLAQARGFGFFIVGGGIMWSIALL